MANELPTRSPDKVYVKKQFAGALQIGSRQFERRCKIVTLKDSRNETVHFDSKGGKKIIPKSLLEDLVKEADERADAPKKDLLQTTTLDKDWNKRQENATY